MADTKYLTQRGDLWLFHWRVPVDCKEAFGGKQYVTKSLKTHSLREANVRKVLALAECMKVVQDVRGAGEDARSLFKAHLHGMKHASDEDLEDAYYTVIDKEPKTEEDLAFREALRVSFRGHDSELARCTLKDALNAYKEDRAGRVTEKTIGQAERAVELFLEYRQLPDVTLQSITRKEVKEFIRCISSEYGGKYAGKTVSNRVNLLSSIYQVALDDELIEEDRRNPFDGHRVSRKDSQSFERFSDDQLKSIFRETERYQTSTKDYHKYFLPRLAYATGCRIEELCSLQRAQVKEDKGIVYLAIAEGVDVYKGKTINSGRRIPIHSSLSDQLLTWRDSSDHLLLFPELESHRKDRKTGDKYSKQFGNLKRKLGITKRSQSFHSFRVHMATNLEQAEVPENRAVWIMGHTRTLSLSYGLYSEGPALEQLRDDVEKCVVWP